MPSSGGEEQQPLSKSSDQEKHEGKGAGKTGDKSGAVFLPEERTPRLTWQEQLAKRLVIRNIYAKIVLAEFMGCFVLVSMGCGAIAQEVVTNKGAGDIVTIVFGWGMAVSMGVYVSGGISGGHINPAFSTAMALLGRLPIERLPFYWIGQYLGCTFGAFCVWAVYYQALSNLDGGTRHSKGDNESDPMNTDGIFGTFPNAGLNVSSGQCFVDQIFATLLLVLVAMGVTDPRNQHPVPKGMCPFVIGMGLVGILCGYVANCGAALNPARDFGPRLFTMIAGWGGGPITYRGGNWFWVPILGPHIGAILGALFYNICVGLHLPDPPAAH